MGIDVYTGTLPQVTTNRSKDDTDTMEASDCVALATGQT